MWCGVFPNPRDRLETPTPPDGVWGEGVYCLREMCSILHPHVFLPLCLDMGVVLFCCLFVRNFVVCVRLMLLSLLVQLLRLLKGCFVL